MTDLPAGSEFLSRFELRSPCSFAPRAIFSSAHDLSLPLSQRTNERRNADGVSSGEIKNIQYFESRSRRGVPSRRLSRLARGGLICAHRAAQSCVFDIFHVILNDKYSVIAWISLRKSHAEDIRYSAACQLFGVYGNLHGCHTTEIDEKIYTSCSEIDRESGRCCFAVSSKIDSTEYPDRC